VPIGPLHELVIASDFAPAIRCEGRGRRIQSDEYTQRNDFDIGRRPTFGAVSS
jgi:hypothetical protein